MEFIFIYTKTDQRQLWIVLFYSRYKHLETWKCTSLHLYTQIWYVFTLFDGSTFYWAAGGGGASQANLNTSISSWGLADSTFNFVICTWETANSCWQLKHTKNHFPIQYLIDTFHVMRTSTNFQNKKKNPKNGGCKNIIKERLISGQLMETSSSFGEGWGQRLSIEAWFMICSVLHVCSQVSGSYTQLEQQGLGVCFSEDKLKLDTFISASAAEELVTALSKVVFFDHPAQNVGNSNRPWQVKRKIQRNTKCL